MDLSSNKNSFIRLKRIRLLYGLLIFVVGVFMIRLFYVQVIDYSHYKTAALNDQLKQYQIPATRGLIEAHNGNSVVPIVLNQELYTLYADPLYIKHPDQIAAKISPIIGGQAATYSSLLKTKNTRYVVLAKKISADKSTQILSLNIPGLGTHGGYYRTYPEGSLAAQVLGFVNDSGQGEYGLEQALNSRLAGQPGQLRAITDASGIPLAASKDNVDIKPVNGSNIVTSVNLAMQAQMEQILASEYKKTKSQGISALIMNPNNGQVLAMANYPTYDPANYQNVSDASLFENGTVTDAIEPGSSMKTLTTSAALDQGVISPNESFYDPAHWVIDGFNITDIEQDGGPRNQTIASILALSLNTGATWMLMQMSNPGSTQINFKGISAWHNYMVNHFRLGQLTGIEQGYESAGYVPPANPNNPAIGLQFANTAFGQGVQVTALQMAAALSSVINGGTYYRPTLVDGYQSSDGPVAPNPPKVVARQTVSSKTGPELIPLMQNVVTTYFHEGYSFMNFPANYLVGGKTGTAQIALPGGGYDSNIYNGTYLGFVGGNKPQYVIAVFNIKPNVPGYAGALGGQPVFADLAHMLINDSFVTPKNN